MVEVWCNYAGNFEWSRFCAVMWVILNWDAVHLNRSEHKVTHYSGETDIVKAKANFGDKSRAHGGIVLSGGDDQDW